MDLLDGFWFLCFISLQTSESCQARTSRQENNDNPVIRAVVKNFDEPRSRSYNKNYDSEVVYYHVGDNCLISCEQESNKYTLSWRQQADDVSIMFPPYNAKSITINVTLERFDHDTKFRCTAFKDATLTTAVDSISFKFNNTHLDSSKNKDPPNLTTDPQCLISDHQAMPYVIIDDKLHNDSSKYPKDTTKVCIHRYCNTKDDPNIHMTRRVTYMNYLKPKKVQELDRDKDLLSNILDDKVEPPENNIDDKKLWTAVGGGTVAALILLLIIIIIWKRKRRSSTNVADPLYATAQELNTVVYADLDMVRGSTFSQTREDVTPYAQVIGVIKPKKKT